MAEVVKTMKLHIYPTDVEAAQLKELAVVCCDAADFVSQYIFDNGFPLNSVPISSALYYTLRDRFGLKAQMTQSVIRMATARYQTVKEQLYKHPYKYKGEDGKWHYITRTLEWLQKPIHFKRPQADLVRNRDYSFVDGGTRISVNTLGKRVKASYDVPDCFAEYFDGSWSFGTAKLLCVNGEWYLHIPMTKTVQGEYAVPNTKHVVGVDRGLRFLATTYDEKGKSSFVNGKAVMHKRQKFQEVRTKLQAKGTKSAKRALKRISGRENRYMADVNHQVSKALVQKYGQGTLFVLEDLTGVSFSEENLSNKSNSDRQSLHTWPFYQLEQFLTYKAGINGSLVIKVPAQYTSQRCPKCGRIHKDNRNHKLHEYICDVCGYRSNDDRIGAMNLQMVGTLYVSGDAHPRIRNTDTGD